MFRGWEIKDCGTSSGIKDCVTSLHRWLPNIVCGMNFYKQSYLENVRI